MSNSTQITSSPICRKCKVKLDDYNWWKSSKKRNDKICIKCSLEKQKAKYDPKKQKEYDLNRKEEKKLYNLEYNKNNLEYNKNRWAEYDSNRNKFERKKYQRNWQLTKKYNITSDEWDKLFKTQNEKCAICKSCSPNNKREYFHTDHCHDKNVVRGILCKNWIRKKCF